LRRWTSRKSTSRERSSPSRRSEISRSARSHHPLPGERRRGRAQGVARSCQDARELLLADADFRRDLAARATEQHRRQSLRGTVVEMREGRGHRRRVDRATRADRNRAKGRAVHQMRTIDPGGAVSIGLIFAGFIEIRREPDRG
jgi:hypothetical protein